jgi:hypothetical protein
VRSKPDAKTSRCHLQTGFDDPSHAQQHSNQQRRQQGGGGNPFGGGGNPFGGGGGRQQQRPKPRGPLEEVNKGNIEAWLQDAQRQKKPVLLLFAPPGSPLIDQLGKMMKNDEVKMAKFGHVAASNDAGHPHPLMKKYQVKRVPAVLIGSTGDPAALNR